MRLAETLRRGPPHNEFKGYLSTLAQDLRYGYRQFRAAPAKAIIAIASLAIGIENLVHALARALCRHCDLCLSDWVYSITSQSVSERNKEIGIRIALGSSKRSILGLFFRQASLPITCGALSGLLGTQFSSRLLRSLLFEVTPNNVLVMGAILLLLTTIAAAAVFIPATRASRIDVSTVLRYE